jgi:porphobilinogen synthase
VPEIAVMTDVALDPYNANGHDGIVRDGEIVNDETVEALVRMALAQAEAGADILGPSDMMDGRIGAMRAALEAAGPCERVDPELCREVCRQASTGRSATRSAHRARSRATRRPTRWTRATRTRRCRLVERDLREGADMVMVKPGMPYLDICRRVKDAFGAPTYAYQVSGEYAMLMGAADRGWLDGDKVMWRAFSPSSAQAATGS